MKKWIGSVIILAVVGILIGMVGIMAIAQGGEAQIPNTIGYQGYLTDSSGIPIEDPVNIVFTLYTAAGGGTPVWSESHNGVDPNNGLFTVELGGSGTPILSGHLTGDRWLGVKIGADAEMTPRQKLSSAGFAIRAEESNNAGTIDSLDSKTILKQTIEDFVVASGKSVTAGDVVEFVDGYVEKYTEELNTPDCGPEYFFRLGGLDTSVSCAALSDTRFVVAFNDSSNNGNVFIGDISGKTIGLWREDSFHPAWTGDLSIAALSKSTFIVAYEDVDNSNQGTVVIGEVSDNGSVTLLGAEYIFNPAATVDCAIIPLDASRFVITYADIDNSRYGTARVGEYSGNSVTGWGAEYVFNPSATYYLAASKLTESKFVAAYADNGNGTAIIGDIPGTAITFGSEYIFNPASTEYISSAGLADNKFVVAYEDRGNSDYGTARVGNVSGGTISYGIEACFNSYPTELTAVTPLSDSTFVVAYIDGGNSDYGTVVVGEECGNGAAMGFYQPVVFDATDQETISVVMVRPDKFVLAGIEDTTMTEGDGKAVVGQIGLYPNMVGIAGESKGSGETVPVIIDGISDVHSGLTPGTLYYSNGNGNLFTDHAHYRIGEAVSPTELLMSPYDQSEDSWSGATNVHTMDYVGIGTSDPDRRLTILGSGFKSELMSFKNNLGDTRWHINMSGSGLNFAESGISSSRLFIAPGGNVGIGTLNPDNRLTVSGTTNFAGNVGIGTINPSRELHVAGEALITGDTYVKATSGEHASIHYGNRGLIGSAVDFNPNLDNNGLWIEGTSIYGESGGIFMNGNTLCLWSPGDDELLRVYDEDDFSTLLFAVDGSGNVGLFGDIYDLNDITLTVNDHLDVNGNLSKASGSFKIDHPLDPENKYLYHSFVESPDMMNVYNGNVILDAGGEAIVELPDWFEALNKDFRYQLTCIGKFAPVYVAEEISGNQFKIAGGEPGMKVSWQVTGIRQDDWANANRIQVEVEKSTEEKGLYLYPEAAGLDETRGISYRISEEHAQEGK